LAESRAKAQALIMAGQVRVEGTVESKSGTPVEAGSRLEVEQGPKFVSRGGEKLEAALQVFGLEVAGRTCADVGASTGGFTDCLLQRGALRVYAIDVGKGTLHWKLRNDRRVVVMEETNARFVESLPEHVSLVTMDASFISLRILLPVCRKWLAWLRPASAGTELTQGDGESRKAARTDVIALVKPQFEAGRKDVSRGDGVIRDPEIHKQVLVDVLHFAHSLDFGVRGLIRSPLLGPKGNVEFLAWLDLSPQTTAIPKLIESALTSAAKSSL
jgi:23S rRNA (cytidine1920-2'-O)/16S rRNA (cytidine1409-2'-O)-methyltransferase